MCAKLQFVSLPVSASGTAASKLLCVSGGMHDAVSGSFVARQAAPAFSCCAVKPNQCSSLRRSVRNAWRRHCMTLEEKELGQPLGPNWFARRCHPAVLRLATHCHLKLHRLQPQHHHTELTSFVVLFLLLGTGT